MGKSHQRGWVLARGRKWYGYFRRTVHDAGTHQPKTVSTPIVLGLKSQMTKTEAREKLASEIIRLTGQTSEEGTVKNGTVTFGWFVRNRYLPLKESDWREETAKVKRYLIEADLLDTFEEIRMENFDKFGLQSHLNQLARTRSRDRVLQIRSYLRAIFAEAVDQDFLSKDPARMVKVPANLREVDKTTLTWDELRAALGKLGDLGLRDWILMKLEMSNALRPSELFPLRWGCFLEEKRVLDIRETLYKGKIRPYGKTKGSITRVPIADVLAQEIAYYRDECRRWGVDTAPGAFMFPDRTGGPMDPGNYRRRVLGKLAEELELKKLNFQVIRRTIATLGKSKGHVKDIQAILRHSKASTTTDVYMQSLEPEVRVTVNSIHEELMSTGTTGEPARKAHGAPPSKGREAHESHVIALARRPKEGLEGKKENRGSAVVLEFATNLLPRNGREVLLND